MDKKLNILFLADTGHHTNAVQDNIAAIKANSPHNWHVENPLTCKILHKIDLHAFDAIGIHYSIRPYRDYYLPKKLYKAIALFKGLKFQFLQDEYQHVNKACDAMAELGIHLLFTLVKPELVDKAYPDARLKQMKKVTILTAYVPDNLLHYPHTPLKDKTIDIFYRSRTCDFWLGRLAQEKVLIAEGVSHLAKKYALKTNISVKEEDRIYGDAWLKTMATSRAVLGTESGASIWDFDGSIEEKCKLFLSKNPSADFNTTFEAILKEHEGNVLYSAISPRIFEAAALKTAMIMFPGWYNGICKPDVHYIPLKKDFSNFDEVVEKLQNDKYLNTLINNAYNDLIASGKYAESQLSKTVNQHIEALLPKTSNIENEVSSLTKEKEKYKKLNYYYVICSEVKFIINNFWKILTDKRSSPSQKIKNLWLGMRRYFVYIIPRYRN